MKIVSKDIDNQFLLWSFAGVFFIFFCIVLSLPDRPQKSYYEEIQDWSLVRPDHITGMWIRPMLAKEGLRLKTISESIEILDRSQVTELFTLLHSSHSWLYFKGSGHWGSERYARIDLDLHGTNSLSFALNWDSSDVVCMIFLMKDPSATVYDYSNLIDMNASSDLATYVDSIVSSQHVDWVSADKRYWEVIGSEPQFKGANDMGVFESLRSVFKAKDSE